MLGWDSMSAAKRVRVVVSGRVTGVGFRFFVERVAHSLDVTGWVRNLPDDRVEAVAEGEERALQDFVAKLRQGPPFARVDDLDADWGQATGDFDDFRIVSYR